MGGLVRGAPTRWARSSRAMRAVSYCAQTSIQAVSSRGSSATASATAARWRSAAGRSPRLAATMVCAVPCWQAHCRRSRGDRSRLSVMPDQRSTASANPPVTPVYCSPMPAAVCSANSSQGSSRPASRAASKCSIASVNRAASPRPPWPNRRIARTVCPRPRQSSCSRACSRTTRVSSASRSSPSRSPCGSIMWSEPRISAAVSAFARLPSSIASQLRSIGSTRSRQRRRASGVSASSGLSVPKSMGSPLSMTPFSRLNIRLISCGDTSGVRPAAAGSACRAGTGARGRAPRP